MNDEIYCLGLDDSGYTIFLWPQDRGDPYTEVFAKLDNCTEDAATQVVEALNAVHTAKVRAMRSLEQEFRDAAYETLN